MFIPVIGRDGRTDGQTHLDCPPQRPHGESLVDDKHQTPTGEGGAALVKTIQQNLGVSDTQEGKTYIYGHQEKVREVTAGATVPYA